MIEKINTVSWSEAWSEDSTDYLFSYKFQNELDKILITN